MELSELQQINDQLNRQIEENVRINKKILVQLLKRKASRKLFWLKLRSGFGLVFFMYLFLSLIPKMPSGDGWIYWQGCALMFIAFIYVYIKGIYTYLILLKIDVTNAVTTQKTQLYKLKKSLLIKKTDCLIPIFFFAGIFFTKMINPEEIRSIPFWILLPMIVLPVIIWLIVNGPTSNPGLREIDRINKALEEIEELEK